MINSIKKIRRARSGDIKGIIILSLILILLLASNVGSELKIFKIPEVQAV